MTSFYPIYNDDPLFGNKLRKNSCPAKSDICGNLPGVSVLDNFLIPKCNDVSFKFSLSPEDSPNGCCVVESSNNTCDTYIPDSPDFTSDDYDMGIQFLDANNLNPRKICHSAPIRKRVINIKDFFITFLISIAIIILTAIVGSCYEFWLKYGAGLVNNDSTKLRYENKCGKSISPIEYAFPSSMNEYPYKNCGDNTKLEFPYSILTYFNVKKTQTQAQIQTENFGYKLVRLYGLPIKSFCLNFLYTLLFSRKILNLILVTLSETYKNINHPAIKNIIFLFLTGIAFSVIAKYTGIQQFNNGVGYILYLLTLVIVFAMMFTLLATNFVLYWSPDYYNKFEDKDETSPPILDKTYSLFSNIFYDISAESKDNKLLKIVFNVCLGLLAIIPFLICLSTGLVGSLFGTLYMILSLVFNIFYIPVSNIGCIFNIIRDHSGLLTILICASALLASVDSLNSTTSGTFGGLLGLLILYKIFTSMT
jgi:hypothetical protein